MAYQSFKDATGATSYRKVTGAGTTGDPAVCHQIIDSGTLSATQSGTWNVTTVSSVTNLSQMGGTAIAMGTGVRSAGTQRVTIATDDVVPVTGTFWQATQPVSLASLPALAAGTNAIGKLSANSGVDIGDVDVTSIPALVAGTALIGKTASGLDVSNLYDGSTALVPKFAKLSSASTGNQALVSAVVGKKIRILALHIMATATTNSVYINDGTADLYADSTRKIPLDVTGATGPGGVSLPFNPVGWFETAATNRPLNVNLGSANGIVAVATYVEV